MESLGVATRRIALLALMSVGCVEQVELFGNALDDGAPEQGPPVADPPIAGGPDTAPGDDNETPEVCETPPSLAGGDIEVASEYSDFYRVFDLGQIEGVPNPLGGVAVKRGSPNTLLVAGGSETADGKLYEVDIRRGPCGHILGFEGAARLVATTPFIDATLPYAPGTDLLFYAEYSRYTISQLPFGANAPAVRTDLTDFGLPTRDDDGPGGLGFVPPGVGTSFGELRMVTWPTGVWYHVDLEPNGDVFRVTGIDEITRLPNNPGGFAYVPAGSPRFDAAAIIVSEWNEDDDTSRDRVAVYDVDAGGDPLPGTRRELLTRFPRPWGAYFEPETGDFLFLSWGTGADRVYVIQGFERPPVVE